MISRLYWRLAFNVQRGATGCNQVAPPVLAWKAELGFGLRGIVSLSLMTGGAFGFLASNTTLLSGIIPACTLFAPTTLIDVSLFLQRAHKQHTRNAVAIPIAAPKIENPITYPLLNPPCERPPPEPEPVVVDDVPVDNAIRFEILLFVAALLVKFHCEML